MRHLNAGRQFNMPSDQRKAMLKSLVVNLLKYERIETTVPRAKEIRGMVDHMITLGKRGDLHARRQALSLLGDKDLVHKLFSDIAPRCQNRNGGYTRVLKTRFRYGDCAPMSFIELVERRAPVVAERSEE
ncbi:MAG: 50S ribosomal protein L17 [Magnetococcales bacterium]|nr:50S ribosomal protein L17 [Magnetococcales bacterium]